MPSTSDNTKYRLIERDDIMTAVRILKLRGLNLEQLTEEITRLFYVDLDTYNEVVQAA